MLNLTALSQKAANNKNQIQYLWSEDTYQHTLRIIPEDLRTSGMTRSVCWYVTRPRGKPEISQDTELMKFT